MVLKYGKAALHRVWSETRAGFVSLHGSPPDLWKVLILKVRSRCLLSVFQHWTVTSRHLALHEYRQNCP